MHPTVQKWMEHYRRMLWSIVCITFDLIWYVNFTAFQVMCRERWDTSSAANCCSQLASHICTLVPANIPQCILYVVIGVPWKHSQVHAGRLSFPMHAKSCWKHVSMEVCNNSQRKTTQHIVQCSSLLGIASSHSLNCLSYVYTHSPLVQSLFIRSALPSPTIVPHIHVCT